MMTAMITRMKALKTFSHSETGVMVTAGTEFETRQARLYESRGRAVIVHPVVQTAIRPAALNRAAEIGPLPLAGGETGGDKPPSSSPAAPARKRRRSKDIKGGLAL